MKGGVGNCGVGDVKCICENKNFLGDIACCLEGTCDKPDQSAAVSYAYTVSIAVKSSSFLSMLATDLTNWLFAI